MSIKLAIDGGSPALKEYVPYSRPSLKEEDINGGRITESVAHDGAED
jgi:hypothetical protein